MNKFHGQVIAFPNLASQEESQAFLKLLPRRHDFLVADIVLRNNITSKQEIFFLPNDIVELHAHTNNRLEYKLMLIGILKDGTKSAVIVEGIQPYFEIQIPADISTHDFTTAIDKKVEQFYCIRKELFKHFPCKYYQIEASSYYRLYFRTLHARRHALEYFLNNDFTYINNRAQRISARLETAADDPSCYFRCVAREWRFKLADWDLLRHYRIDNSGQYTRSNCIEYTFILDVANIIDARSTGWDPTSDPIKNREFIRDYSMEMNWDLETSTGEGPVLDTLPMIENVFNSSGKEADVIFMQSCSFAWYSSIEPFLVVCFTDLVSPPRSDCLIIQCRNQLDIIHTKALLVERMVPEFIAGFNDGSYDWPFVLRRAEKYDVKYKTTLIKYLKKHMSVIPYTEENAKYTIRGSRKEKIKIEAGVYVDVEFFDVPGFICMDVRTIFRQIYPSAEKSSLNFFLAINKLGSKEDMPYTTMFKVYRVIKRLSTKYKTSIYAELLTALQAEITEAGAEFRPWPKDKTGPLRLDELTLADILALVQKSSDVVHYCNIDAQKCHALLHMRNVIADRREIANMSYTSMYDAIYRANGMKVRNLVISEGIRPEWNIAFSCRNAEKDLRKYPGAYVVPPKKGLYRDHRNVKTTRRIAFSSPTHTTITPATATAAQHAVSELEINSENDRPCSGLDAQSLYPSIIMNYNLSLAKVVIDEAVMLDLSNRINPQTKQLHKFIPVEFRYGLKSQEEEQKELVRGWVVQHLPVFDETGKNITSYLGMGIYPYILKKLFDIRVGIKKRVEYYNNPKEYLDKVFEYCKNNNIALSGLNAISPAEQQSLVLQLAKKELTDRKAAAAANPKEFYHMRVKAMQEIIHFLHVEYIPETRNGTCESDTLMGLFAEIVFYVNYYNTKQNGLKVYMNTFYGETGNSQSSFFIKQVAGAITTYGQKTLKLVKSFVESKGCSVKYGDTDSLYISPPEHVFTNVDQSYESGKTTIQQYWTNMIELTMEYLDILRGDVNELLYRTTGARFLRMAYEEVLWPYAFVGKKKYLGVQHQGIVNLRICMPDCTLSEFINSKSLFLRGMEVKKRGSSELLKILCYEVMKACFCITETRTMREIVEQKLHEIATRKFEPHLFIKSAKYKLPAPGKPGNVSVLRFAQRMTAIETAHPQLKIRAPEVGERFSYIIAECYPWVYDLRGRKSKIKAGDRYEFFESLKNTAYCAIRSTVAGVSETDMRIDIDYYITNEVIGQFARFLTYHHDYDKFYTGADINNQQDDDEAYKIADKKACDFAKKELKKYYKLHYAKKWENRGSIYKIIYKDSYGVFKDACVAKYDEAAVVLELANKLIFDAKPNALRYELQKELIRSAQSLGISLASDKNMIQIARDNHWDPFQLYRRYISGTRAIIPERLKSIKIDISKCTQQLNLLLPKFEQVCLEHFIVLKDLLQRKHSILAPTADSTDTLIELIQDKLPFSEEVYEMSDIYYNLASLYKLQKECALIEEEIKYLKELKVGAKPMPISIKKENLSAQFMDWLKARNGDAQ